MLILLMSLTGICAQTVDILILEDDLVDGKLSPYTDRLLVACLDGLYSTGLIATNETPIEGSLPVFLDPLLGISGARSGSADYLLAILFIFGERGRKNALKMPESAHWKFVRIIDAKVLSSGEIAIAPDMLVFDSKFDQAIEYAGIEIINRGIVPLVSGF